MFCPLFLLYKGAYFLLFKKRVEVLLRLHLVHLLIVLCCCCRRLSLFQYLDRMVLLYQYGSFVLTFVTLKSVNITSK